MSGTNIDNNSIEQETSIEMVELFVFSLILAVKEKHEHECKPYSVGFTDRWHSHPRCPAPAELHCCNIFDNYWFDWAVRQQFSFSLKMIAISTK